MDAPNPFFEKEQSDQAHLCSTKKTRSRRGRVTGRNRNLKKGGMGGAAHLVLVETFNQCTEHPLELLEKNNGVEANDKCREETLC